MGRVGLLGGWRGAKNSSWSWGGGVSLFHLPMHPASPSNCAKPFYTLPTPCGSTSSPDPQPSPHKDPACPLKLPAPCSDPLALLIPQPLHRPCLPPRSCPLKSACLPNLPSPRHCPPISQLTLDQVAISNSIQPPAKLPECLYVPQLLIVISSE